MQTDMKPLTEDERRILKLGIMALHDRGFISEMAAEWLIQSLGLSDA